MTQPGRRVNPRQSQCQRAGMALCPPPPLLGRRPPSGAAALPAGSALREAPPDGTAGCWRRCGAAAAVVNRSYGETGGRAAERAWSRTRPQRQHREQIGQTFHFWGLAARESFHTAGRTLPGAEQGIICKLTTQSRPDAPSGCVKRGIPTLGAKLEQCAGCDNDPPAGVAVWAAGAGTEPVD